MSAIRVNAVFEGGGVKGIGLAGAVLACEENGITWANVAGTSAGAMVASLIAVGYCGREIRDMLGAMDYSIFKDKIPSARLPYIGPIFSIVKHKGICKGDFLENWLRDKYIKKGKMLFKDMKTECRDECLKYKLRVIASDITNKRLVVLPQDIKKYGVDPDSLDIARAVRMSMSLPLFFVPIVLRCLYMNEIQESIIVDGGLLSNFPVWLFDSKYEMRPTIGFRLAEPVHKPDYESMNVVNYLLNIISTMSEAFDQRYIEDSNFQRTIMIPTVGVNATDFNISQEKSKELFQSGYIAAQKFLNNNGKYRR